MDPTRFDALARWWAGSTRRGMLRLGVGGGVAALLARLGINDASAKCVNPGKRCKKKNGKKKKCCGGAKCKGKKCACQTGGLACGANCCQPGQLCLTIDNVSSCINGILPVGGACDPQVPLACSTGQCGCNGNLCACREANCVNAGQGCAGSLECCQGVCVANVCTGG